MCSCPSPPGAGYFRFALALLLLLLPIAGMAAAGELCAPLDIYMPLYARQSPRYPLETAACASPLRQLLPSSLLYNDWAPEKEMFSPDHFVSYMFATVLDAQEYPVDWSCKGGQSKLRVS
jgi:hypothetical protein